MALLLAVVTDQILVSIGLAGTIGSLVPHFPTTTTKSFESNKGSLVFLFFEFALKVVSKSFMQDAGQQVVVVELSLNQHHKFRILVWKIGKNVCNHCTVADLLLPSHLNPAFEVF